MRNLPSPAAIAVRELRKTYVIPEREAGLKASVRSLALRKWRIVRAAAGTLDLALTKREDAQLIISVREVRIWQLVDVLAGTIVIVVAALRLPSGIGAWQAISFVGLLACGGLMIYSFWLILTTAAFWIV